MEILKKLNRDHREQGNYDIRSNVFFCWVVTLLDSCWQSCSCITCGCPQFSHVTSLDRHILGIPLLLLPKKSICHLKNRVPYFLGYICVCMSVFLSILIINVQTLHKTLLHIIFLLYNHFLKLSRWRIHMKYKFISHIQ